MARAVTAKDVAREAGVSQATVSYVINAHPGQKISAPTRERVQAAIDRLGYTPSESARALRKGSSNVVLLVLPDIPFGPTLAHLIEQIADELEPFGLTTITRRVRATSPLASHWRSLQPVAVVSIAAISPEDEAEMQAAGVLVVSALLSPSSQRLGISVPQTLIGRMQVEHLAYAGHRHLGYAAPDDVRVTGFYQLRLEGVRSACLDLGLADPVVVPVALDTSSAEQAVRYWRSLPDPVTAVAAYNDETAFAVLAGMQRLGLSAPRDLAVIGVDNIPLAALASPPLTTIDQNLGMVAAYVARQIASVTHGIAEPMPLRSDAVTLVLRESA
ncbi:LacI family DNA-binding transcriptional regulator [Cellulomonas sp. ICMP 17802]|uniref:LacI family DNA-binding transcriptional regulator n=1 Tax=Cellulomonas sp. ICMP 17802 TaxID=3239199 RepID=UPI00351BA046